MNREQFLYMGLELVIFCIPIATLIWKAGKQAQKIEDHEKRIATLEDQVERTLNSELNRMKVDIAEIKTAIMYIKENLPR